MYASNNYNDSKFSSEQLAEVVERLKAVECKWKTIFYSSDVHKTALEQLFNVQIGSDDLIVENLEGRFRLIKSTSLISALGTENTMFVVDGIWEG